MLQIVYKNNVLLLDINTFVCIPFAVEKKSVFVRQLEHCNSGTVSEQFNRGVQLIISRNVKTIRHSNNIRLKEYNLIKKHKDPFVLDLTYGNTTLYHTIGKSSYSRSSLPANTFINLLSFFYFKYISCFRDNFSKGFDRSLFDCRVYPPLYDITQSKDKRISFIPTEKVVKCDYETSIRKLDILLAEFPLYSDLINPIKESIEKMMSPKKEKEVVPPTEPVVELSLGTIFNTILKHHEAGLDIYVNSMPVADFAFYKTIGGKDILYISYTINKDATNFIHANQVRSLKVVHKEIVII